MKLIDKDNNVVEEYSYDAYGKIISSNKTIETNNPYTYTARVQDDKDLYYYRARYYDPTVQRFLSLDPIGFLSGDFNFYRYVGNNPLNFRDPFGEIKGPFGGKCGEEGTDAATWIPDVSPLACEKHDACYATEGKSQRECDYEFFKSNPIYGAAVILGGKSAYDKAQKKCK